MCFTMSKVSGPSVSFPPGRVSVFSARADARTNQLSSAGLSGWMETARMDIDVRVSRFRGMWHDTSKSEVAIYW